MKNIEWNRVTWYSWVAAVIVFGGIFVVGILLGMKIQETRDLSLQPAVSASPGGATASSSTSSPIIATVTYACDEGKQVQAIYRKGQVEVSTSDGQDLTLPQTISADGGRYANTDESFVFWSKGNGAFIQQTVKGISTTTYANCTQIAAPVGP